MTARILSLLFWLGLLGCQAELRNGHYGCATDQDCPEGWSCWSNQLCYDQAQIDGGPVDDRGFIGGDAAPFDGGRPDGGGVQDGGGGDVPSTDASTLDATGIDGSVEPDTGTPEDAGPVDANPPLPRLTNLTVLGGDLEPAFSPDHQGYQVRYHELSQTLTVQATSDPRVAISIDGALTQFGSAQWGLDVTTRTAPVPVVVESGGESFPITLLLQPAWGIGTYFKAPIQLIDNFLGYSLDLDGDTMVVGAYGDSSDATTVNGDPNNARAPRSGAAYVFVRDGTGVWTQQAYLKAANSGANDYFGISVAISGDRIAVGAPYEAGTGTGVNPPVDEGGLNNGAVYVFVRNGTTWTQEAYLKGSNTQGGDQFGGSVAIDGNTLVASSVVERSGATGVNGDSMDTSAPFSGAAYVFERRIGAWFQDAYLKASNTGSNDQFGFDVAVHGDTVAVSALLEDGPGDGIQDSGAVYTYQRVFGIWTSAAYLKASNAGDLDYFGAAIDLTDGLLIASAYGEDGSGRGVDPQPDDQGPNSGAAYLYRRTPNGWGDEVYLKPTVDVPFESFAKGVAVSDGLVAVGSWTGQRGVEIFRNQGGTWFYRGTLDRVGMLPVVGGFDVSVSAGRVAVGAPDDGSTATGIGGVPGGVVYPNSGAAFVLEP